MSDQQVNPAWFTALGILLIVVGMIAIGTPLMATLAMNIFGRWIVRRYTERY